MKSKAIFFTSVLCAAMCFSMPDFETAYQPILKRMPFGSTDITTVSPTNTTDPRETIAKANLARTVNMSAMNIMPNGRTAIGFTDLSAKPPVNYHLMVGESEGGWTVLDANYEEETATLVKDGVEITLQYGKGLVETPALSGRPGRDGVMPGVNAGMPPNATAAAPGFAGAGERPLPSGLVRAERPAAPSGAPSARDRAFSAVGGKQAAGTAAATPPATPPAGSYTERLDARLKEEQRKKDEADLVQKEQLTRLAASAAAEALRREKEEAAREAEERGEPVPDEVNIRSVLPHVDAMFDEDAH